MLSTAHSTALPDEGHEAVFLIREVIRKRAPALLTSLVAYRRKNGE
jgi:hypothetical protein